LYQVIFNKPFMNLIQHIKTLTRDIIKL